MKWLCLENWETLWSGIQGPRCHTEKLESFLVFIHIAQCLITLALSWRLKLSLIPLYHPSYSSYSSSCKTIDSPFKINPESGFSSPSPPLSPSPRLTLHCLKQVPSGLNLCSFNSPGCAHRRSYVHSTFSLKTCI